MEQYVYFGRKILESGVESLNERTGVNVRAISNVIMQYRSDRPPLLHSKQVNYRGAIAELLGYLRGYTNAEDFAKVGTRTWFANANKNESWLANPFRQGENDLGLIYGAVGNEVPRMEHSRLRPFSGNYFAHSKENNIKVLEDIIQSLKNRKDNRGLIWNFWNPSFHHLGALRPCMYSHQFILIGDQLDLLSIQRSGDWALGVPYNMVQCWILLKIMTELTGLKQGDVTHVIANAHLYEPHYERFKQQIDIFDYSVGSDKNNQIEIVCHKPITYESVFGLCENPDDNLVGSDFTAMDYSPCGKIIYPLVV